MAESSKFVHLHLHSQYSLLDGGNRLDRLVKRVKELGMDSVAVTDHGNLFGAAEFYSRAREAGIKPILGIEAYVALGDRKDRTATGVKDGGFHLVLLAENETGWRNLLKLSSDSYIHGFYYKPRMDKSTLEQYGDGLIAINGHLGSSLAWHLVKFDQTRDDKHYQAAIDEARWHARTFGTNEKGEPRFFVELQRHDTQDQIAINPHLVRLAEELNLPLVCDNDAHFLLDEDWDTHDTLCCISMNKTKAEPNRLRYPKELFVKSPDEMRQTFFEADEIPSAAAEQAIANTVSIAERCQADVDFGANHAPVVKIVKKGADARSDEAAQEKNPVGSTDWYKAFCAQYELVPFDTTRDHESPEQLKEECDTALRELCEAGLTWRYGPPEIGVLTNEHRARLDRELKILADKNISAYFLIVWDFVNEARRRGIPANARGSGVGTMVGYVLGLSNACPVAYGLLFERFTDPDRSEYPDIDIDMCQNGRGEIIDYVREKYGHVAQIITFNVMKAKAAVRDVGRVLGVPIAECDKVCKLIGDALGTTIDKAMDQEPDLRALYKDSPMHKELIDTARKLEGMARHFGVHAAGVIIATQPLDNIVPLGTTKQGNKDIIITQWDGPTCEKVGLLKMDFLGLRTLSIIERAKKLVRETLNDQAIREAVSHQAIEPPSHEGEENSPSEIRNSKSLPDPLDLDRLTFDDQRVLDLFRRGETAGVFQFESGGMRNTLMGMKPDRLEDLIAANALFRPGPMELIGDYNDRKHGRSSVPPAHEIVQKFTDETYGIMVYQEQVMQVVHELGGIPLRQAYSLIKAISKKKEKIINANRDQFIKGSVEKGVKESEANELFGLILKFAGYGFNKSHSTGYAIVAYQTAYLKTYFPVHYMAALLTFESTSTDKVVEYMDECRRVRFPDGKRGVPVRPPDINLSDVEFTVVYDKNEPQDANHGHIRFGLNAVKGVGEKAINAVIAAREKSGPFTSLYDFCERVALGSVNRSTIEALIKCGAFDTVHGINQRAAMCEALEAAITAGQRAAADRDSGQMNFFGGGMADDSAEADAAAAEVKLPTIKPWSNNELLKHEQSVLGLYLSSHPLDEHRETIHRFTNASVAEAIDLRAGAEVIVGGILSRVRPTFVKNGRSAGQKMAMISIEDGPATLEGVVFSDNYAVASPLLETDRIVILRGKIDRRRESPNIIVEEVIPIEQAAERLTQSVRVVLNVALAAQSTDAAPTPFNGELIKLRELLRQSTFGANGHAAEVILEVHDSGKVVDLRLSSLRINVDRDLPQRIETVLKGRGQCLLIGPPRLVTPATSQTLIHQDGDDVGPRLVMHASHDDVCASVDRY